MITAAATLEKEKIAEFLLLLLPLPDAAAAVADSAVAAKGGDMWRG